MAAQLCISIGELYRKDEREVSLAEVLFDDFIARGLLFTVCEAWVLQRLMCFSANYSKVRGSFKKASALFVYSLCIITYTECLYC